MAENSGIEWTDHTFNPWTGCTKVSPACDHCYAEAWSKRSGHVEWGPHGERRRTKTWGNPVKWNRKAGHEGKRFRVFCASLADVFDNHRSIQFDWRRDLYQLIDDTPNLDWLLLTKRQEHVLFLKGALNAVTKTHHPPEDREAMRHFLEGSQAVLQGMIVINDIDAMRQFIGDVQTGKWPPKMETRL